MRIMTAYAGRPDYYDRRSGRVIKSISNPIQGPSAGTTQWQYTVPSGKLFYIEHLFGLVMRYGTSSLPGLAQLRIYVTPSGGDDTDIFHLPLYSNSRCESIVRSSSRIGVLESGDKITCLTTDGSSDGTHYYVATMIGFLFEP